MINSPLEHCSSDTGRASGTLPQSDADTAEHSGARARHPGSAELLQDLLVALVAA